MNKAFREDPRRPPNRDERRTRRGPVGNQDLAIGWLRLARNRQLEAQIPAVILFFSQLAFCASISCPLLDSHLLDPTSAASVLPSQITSPTRYASQEGRRFPGG